MVNVNTGRVFLVMDKSYKIIATYPTRNIAEAHRFSGCKIYELNNLRNHFYNSKVRKMAASYKKGKFNINLVQSKTKNTWDESAKNTVNKLVTDYKEGMLLPLLKDVSCV